MGFIKFYDNGASIEIGVPAGNKSMLSSDSTFDNGEITISVNLSKDEVVELTDFLGRKLKEME